MKTIYKILVLINLITYLTIGYTQDIVCERIGNQTICHTINSSDDSINLPNLGDVK